MNQRFISDATTIAGASTTITATVSLTASTRPHPPRALLTPEQSASLTVEIWSLFRMPKRWLLFKSKRGLIYDAQSSSVRIANAYSKVNENSLVTSLKEGEGGRHLCDTMCKVVSKKTFLV